MALLQISEPGQAPDPHQRRIAVGIDLGTTHSLVAAVRNGVAECLPDDKGRVILPSAVRYLDADRRQIGYEALAARAEDPANTITSVKRLMGRGASDIAHREAMPYRLTDESGMLKVQTVAGEKSPVEISAEILATLRYRAEDTFDEALYGAVITVPAYFDEGQRQATKDAAQLAGLNVLRLISEPTAAAIAYGLDNASEGVYAVYDLGGGTFDISILRLTQGVFEVVATGGDSALGGDDYDRALADFAVAQLGRKAGGAGDLAALLVAGRAAKEALTDAAEVDFVAGMAGEEARLRVKRSQFEEATKTLTDRTIAAVRKALRDARLEAEELQGIVLVGGATR
ncbi:MAG: Fe-S protein assembly chaperone HscA, partial [Polaromonas sp.]|nr:Fe-S protein assembly chaperone HscA [Polaromonas sp.]